MWKTSNKLYFESKKESKQNQRVNIQSKFNSSVDNCYRYDNHIKKFTLQSI